MRDLSTKSHHSDVATRLAILHLEVCNENGTLEKIVSLNSLKAPILILGM